MYGSHRKILWNHSFPEYSIYIFEKFLRNSLILLAKCDTAMLTEA